MQPYLFPYLGYFQLVNAADTFVFYDDVSFQKQGWINRNRIMAHGSPLLFTVPLRSVRSGTPINETVVDRQGYPRWCRRFRSTIAQAYASSPQLPAVLSLLDDVLTLRDPSIASLASQSVQRCCEYLRIDSHFKTSSCHYPASGPTGAARVLEICEAASAATYVNAPGGRGLYDPEEFARRRLALRFLSPQLDPYPQRVPGFIPGLSILDVLLCLDRESACARARLGQLT